MTDRSSNLDLTQYDTDWMDGSMEAKDGGEWCRWEDATAKIKWLLANRDAWKIMAQQRGRLLAAEGIIPAGSPVETPIDVDDPEFGLFAGTSAAAEIERLRRELNTADDLLCCSDASESLENATPEDWQRQVDAWRDRNGFADRFLTNELPDETSLFQPPLTANECWEAVNSLIKPGADLPGNGCDGVAERNGLILAANQIAELIQKRGEVKTPSPQFPYQKNVQGSNVHYNHGRPSQVGTCLHCGYALDLPWESLPPDRCPKGTCHGF